MPNQEGLPNETWRIYVSKETTNALLNVDVFSSYGNQTILVENFDEFGDQYCHFDVQQSEWRRHDDGHLLAGWAPNFFYRNQDAATE